jgi:hypothetical protein
MVQPQPVGSEYARAIAERDEAVAQRDFMLTFMHDLGRRG